MALSTTATAQDPGRSSSATALGVSTILWLTLTQWLVSAMGGYLTGRLRTRWTDVHTDEVYFRDTAEVGSIFMHVDLSEPLPPEDVRCVGQIVAQRTGLSQPDAERRVVEVYAKAQGARRGTGHS